MRRPESLIFRDMLVDFILEEWQQLDPAQNDRGQTDLNGQTLNFHMVAVFFLAPKIGPGVKILMIHRIFLLEFWEVDEQIDNYKESQYRPLWQAAFIDQETLKDENVQECRTYRKIIYISKFFVSITQRYPKYSWRRCLKRNIGLDPQPYI
uniref:KRAB domain-containing protein n=1 Tax=Spermophilus dauricus TaxID=99837 RepID=A0A8C9UUZ0_SPEDA